MTLLQLLLWMAVALAGAIAHEVAHHLVWLATGRKPRLDVWGLQVVPTAGPPNGTLGDRVAGAAPYVCGLTALVWAFVSGRVSWAIFGLAMVQLPSRADVAAMRGDVRWASLVDQ